MLRVFRRIRRWHTYPVLILPLQRGPLHGFYHFFVGYFLPVFWFSATRPSTKVAIMDSTPFNEWFELLPGLSPEILPRDTVVKIAYRARLWGFAQGYRVRAFVGWDKREFFAKRKFPLIHQRILSRISTFSTEKKERMPKIILLGRDFTPLHYRGKLKSRYGVAKRNIPNLGETAKFLSEKWDLELVDPATLSPLGMAQKTLHAEILIGQHGAALANMFFLRPKSHVIEIGWEQIREPQTLDMYRRLATELGHYWQRPILQEDRFDAIDPTELESVLEKTLSAGKTNPSG